MKKERPYVPGIAGLDPSGGAGILADVKTFEAHKVTGLGICTALTFQSEDSFSGLQWIPFADILYQAESLFGRYAIDYAKIGLIESEDILAELLEYLHGRNPGIKIVWDPVFKASAGYEFRDRVFSETIEALARRIFLITPNRDEIEMIYPELDPYEGAKRLSAYCNVLLKGGHDEKDPGRDYLFSGEKVFSFRPKRLSPYGKHGSGCVLSSAITANLAKGHTLHRSCLRAKDYITQFFHSSSGLLGYHKL